MKEYNVLQILPQNNEKVLCFGHKTCCCKLDMDEKPEWHEVTFTFHISYRLKVTLPEDIEDSVIEYSILTEEWSIYSSCEHVSCEHVIGVTKWKKRITI